MSVSTTEDISLIHTSRRHVNQKLACRLKQFCPFGLIQGWSNLKIPMNCLNEIENHKKRDSKKDFVLLTGRTSHTQCWQRSPRRSIPSRDPPHGRPSFSGAPTLSGSPAYRSSDQAYPLLRVNSASAAA